MIQILSPYDCSEEELERFHEMLLTQHLCTANGLMDRIKRAERLGFIYSEAMGDTPLGIGALKRPYPDYTNRVFAQAGSATPANIHLELGWLYILPAFRRQGLCNYLVSFLLDGIRRPIYATCGVNNQNMIRVLENFSFRRAGSPWQSSLHTSERLALWIRPQAERISNRRNEL